MLEKLQIKDNPKNGFETITFLPESEGGLRTRNNFKKSYDDKPLISIITVVYNGEKYLEETIQCVINQTYENIEYIIIDGGSTDRTLEIIKKYENKIDYWVSHEDDGIYDAMNKGIRLAAGEWVLFLGSDDKLFSPLTITSIPFLDCNECALITGKVIYNTGEKVISSMGFKTLLHNTIHHQASFYHKDILNNWQYDLTYKLISDYELNLSLYLANAKTTMIDEVISFCREGGASRTNLKVSYQETNKIRQKHLGKKSFLLAWIYSIKIIISLLKNTFYAK